MPEKKKKLIATLNNDWIQSILNLTCQFLREEDARDHIDRLAAMFVKRKPRPDDTEEVVSLWVRGYEVTEDEKARGGTGNYARLRVVRSANGLFLVVATKESIPVTEHPQKERRTLHMPNWGHPVLRASERSKPYPTAEGARQELQKLALEYPKSSRLVRPDRLDLYVYGRAGKQKGDKPYGSYTMEVHAAPDGTFRLRTSEKVIAPRRIPDYGGVGPGPNAEPDRKWAELLARLHVTDDREAKLFQCLRKLVTLDAPTETWTVLLVVPGEPDRPPSKCYYSPPGMAHFRLTRAYAAADPGVAYFVNSLRAGNRYETQEYVAVLQPDGTWVSREPPTLPHDPSLLVIDDEIVPEPLWESPIEPEAQSEAGGAATPAGPA